MRIVQNFSAIELDFNPADKRLPLNYEHLENKKIQAMYLLSSIPDVTIKSPYTDKDISDMGILGTEDFYLNVVDVSRQEVVKSLCFNSGYFMLDCDDNRFIEYYINRLIDVKKSYIQYMINTGTHIRTLLLLVFYQSEHYKPFTDEVTGSASFSITPSAEDDDILLQNIIENKLSGKLIKRIIVRSTNGFNLLSYLDLYTHCGKRIENIPTTLLNESGQKTIYFDNLNIDWTKSYFRQRGIREFEENGQIVTYANFELTFIY